MQQTVLIFVLLCTAWKKAHIRPMCCSHVLELNLNSYNRIVYFIVHICTSNRGATCAAHALQIGNPIKFPRTGLRFFSVRVCLYVCMYVTIHIIVNELIRIRVVDGRS